VNKVLVVSRVLSRVSVVEYLIPLTFLEDSRVAPQHFMTKTHSSFISFRFMFLYDIDQALIWYSSHVN
jgi:hypothetical protein